MTLEADQPIDPYVDRHGAAEAISKQLFPTSARALRQWDAPRTVTISGRACARLSDWLAEARKRLDEALFTAPKRSEVRRASLRCARQTLAEIRSAERAA